MKLQFLSKKKNVQFIIFAALALGIAVIAVLAPKIATYDPYEAVLHDALKEPSSEHWFGTDALGRDLFSRIIFGARTAVSSSLILVTISLVIGMTAGVAAG